MRGIVHHVVLTVRNTDQCFPLYDTVLTALGYRLERKDERDFGWYLETPSGSHSIHVAGASEDGAKRRHDRYSPGLHTSHGKWTVGRKWIACMNAYSVSAPPSSTRPPSTLSTTRGVDTMPCSLPTPTS